MQLKIDIKIVHEISWTHSYWNWEKNSSSYFIPNRGKMLVQVTYHFSKAEGAAWKEAWRRLKILKILWHSKICSFIYWSSNFDWNQNYKAKQTGNKPKKISSSTVGFELRWIKQQTNWYLQNWLFFCYLILS